MFLSQLSEMQVLVGQQAKFQQRRLRAGCTGAVAPPNVESATPQPKSSRKKPTEYSNNNTAFHEFPKSTQLKKVLVAARPGCIPPKGS